MAAHTIADEHRLILQAHWRVERGLHAILQVLYGALVVHRALSVAIALRAKLSSPHSRLGPARQPRLLKRLRREHEEAGRTLKLAI